jgi:hypothetical protein
MNDERYTERLKLRMTTEEKKKIQDKAAAAGMNISEYMRALIDRKKIVVAPELPELLRQIIRIGTNVNQILLVNENYGTASKDSTEKVKSNLSAVTAAVSDLVTEIKCRKDTTRYKI